MKPEHIETIKKYNKPTAFDNAPYGALWEEIEGDCMRHFYVQVSKEEGSNEWLPIGQFLEAAFGENILKRAVLDELLDLYQETNGEKNIVDNFEEVG